MENNELITAEKLSFSSTVYLVTRDKIFERPIEEIMWLGATAEFRINTLYRCRRKDTSAVDNSNKTALFFNRREAESHQITLRNLHISELGAAMDKAIEAYNAALKRYSDKC